MRRFRFVGDPSDYDWNVELIKNYIYNEDVELNGFMGILSTLEMAKDQDENDPILADWQEVFDPALHKDTDLGYFAGLLAANGCDVSVAVWRAKELIKQLDNEVV